MCDVFAGQAALAGSWITAYFRFFQLFAAAQLVLSHPGFKKRQFAIHALNQQRRIKRCIELNWHPYCWIKNRNWLPLMGKEKQSAIRNGLPRQCGMDCERSIARPFAGMHNPHVVFDGSDAGEPHAPCDLISTLLLLF